MENTTVTMVDLIVETHIGLKRQGPGSSEITARAVSFLAPLNERSKVLDLGCGTGGQTMVLAQHIPGKITGIDQFSPFIDVFNHNAKKLNLEKRVTGMVGSMENLSFPKEKFDLIWSEGAIDGIGFEKGLTYWNGFLKKDGYVAVTCPCWLTDQQPGEVKRFWIDAGSGLDTIEHNISLMQRAGYSFVAAFTLPEKCWTEEYFIPRAAAEKALMKKYVNNKTVQTYIQADHYEVALYSKYKEHYGYVFYIGKKI